MNYIYFCAIIMTSQSQIEEVVLKNKYSLRNIELQIDRSNPRQIYLVVKDLNNKYHDYLIELPDVTKAIEFKQFLEEARKTIVNTEYLMLDSYIDDLLNKWNY